MTKEQSIALSDSERAVVEAVARQREVSFEEALQQLVAEGLAARVRKTTGRRPGSNVVRFRRGVGG